jgi:acyl carrier protein
MDTSEIRRIIIETLLRATRQDNPVESIADSTPLGTGGLGVSSLGLLQAFVKVEERFGITFEDASVANAAFSTVGELVAYIVGTLRPASEEDAA